MSICTKANFVGLYVQKAVLKSKNKIVKSVSRGERVYLVFLLSQSLKESCFWMMLLSTVCMKIVG